ncbi:MAG TPA: ABC transporter ATP-binding protein [Terriglobales bacterium]|nr:ABC transporter ATP-binding protein [Terriglobales bacterium]
MALIDVRDIGKVYDVGDIKVNALENVTLTIGESEFVSIMGPSGSGKSTFMNLLGCLDTPTSGTYLLDGRDVSRLDRDQRAEIRNKKVGFVFQGFNLLSRSTAVENVELPLLYDGIPPRDRRSLAEASLRNVGLAGREAHRPNQLSGGEQQRVAIARALVKGAPIILADEPTGNLDTKMSVGVMELFVKLNEENHITIVLVTHEPDIAAYSRRIIRFRDGRVTSDMKTVGTRAERTSAAWAKEASR